MANSTSFRTMLALALFIAGAPAALAQSDPGPATATTAPASAGAFGGAAIYISDVARSTKFYRDALGLQVLMQYDPAAADKSKSPGGRASRPSRLDTVLTFGGVPPGPMLMLLSDRDPAGPRKITHPFGFGRLVFMMPDLQAVSANLTRHGFKPGEIVTAHGSVRLMMVTDPDGYTLEIIETVKTG